MQYRSRLTALIVLAALIDPFAGFAAPPTAPGDMPRATDVTPADVATQPLGDVNLQKKQIPEILLAIVDDPYALDSIVRCREVVAAVRALDEVLGPDFDNPMELSRGKKRRKSAMAIASGAIGALIPFRFLIREISGANKTDEAFRTAIYAGVVRRGFLKGYGKARGCKAPGSPVPLIEASAGDIRTPLR